MASSTPSGTGRCWTNCAGTTGGSISIFYYFDVSWQETVRCHASTQATEFSVQDMTKWYSPDDRLGFESETIISEDSTLDMIVRRILREGLGVFPATLGAPDKP